MEKAGNRRDFMKALAATPLAARFLGGTGSVSSAGPFEGAGEAKVLLEPFDFQGVRLLDGMLKQQYDATRDFYFNIPDDDILKGFRERAGLSAPGNDLGGWYSGDPKPKGDWPKVWPRLLFSRGDMFNMFGQWLSGMARMSKATGDVSMRDKAVHLMREWARTIAPDGYFYYSRNPIAPEYTYDKTASGLLDLYEYAGEKEALPLLDRITDWAIKNLDRSRVNPDPVNRSGVGGCEWYTLSENLYRAYLLTGDSKFKIFGDVWRYPAYWNMFSGDGEPTPYGLHAYSHCNTLSSAAMTYAVTGEPQYLKTITRAFDWFEKTQMYATGGYGPDEDLQPPDGSLGKSLETCMNTFETPCGSWGGFKLSRYLLSFTGEAKYGDWTEKLVYNGIGAALPMQGRGRTFYYADYRLGGGRKVYHRDKWPCCSGTYILGVTDYHNLIYFKAPDALYVNLFIPSEVVWNKAGDEIKVRQETDYPEADMTTLTIQPHRSVAFGLRFRVPRWSSGAEVDVNGSRVQVAAQPGTWAAIRREWNPGDQVHIRILMEPYTLAIDSQHPNRVAFLLGPVVLVRADERLQRPAGGDLSRSLVHDGDRLHFRAEGRSTDLFVPFYRIGFEEPYTMYFDLEG